MKKIEQLEIIAKDLLAKIEKLKQFESDTINKDIDCETKIDLANTWCEATEENYNALSKLGYKDEYYTSFKGREQSFNPEILFVENKINSGKLRHSKGKKQIKLVNDKFEYVENVEETKDSNNKINEVLYEYDLEINFNGYPLESIAYIISNEIKEYFIEEEFKRYPKNKKYKLVLTLEEYE